MSPLLRYGHHAMATEFDVVFADAALDPALGKSLAALVFQEIDRIEEELTKFKSTSDVWKINGLRAGESVNVDFATLDCLMLAKAVHAETAGAFDVTIGPLMKCWRNQDGSPRTPSEEELTATRQRVGLHLLEVDQASMAVRVLVDHLEVDLGAVGKGYALDQAVRLLEENEVRGALLSAGGSTLLAYGEPPQPDGWPINLALASPRVHFLRETALSCSGFDVKGNHLMDPRSGRPLAISDERCYVQAPTAALSDALSTAFAVLEEDLASAVCTRFPAVEWLRR